jgi:hypothetical protein
MPVASLSLELTIVFDRASARFVQTLAADDTVLRRYPNETQLAFSRGICAYEKARRAHELAAESQGAAS